MNNPEYILTDEFATITAQIKIELGLPVLNFQYGYIRELNETLLQWSKNPTDSVVKFPLVWLEQPFTIKRNALAAYYGQTSTRVFIMAETNKTYKAKDRMDITFKGIIYPIYRELLNQIDLSVAFHTISKDQIAHSIQDVYYWGEAQKTILSDAVDCSIVSFDGLMIANNQNCLTFNSIT